MVQRRERKRGCGSHRTPGLGYTGASLELGLRKLGLEVQTGVLSAEFPFQTSEAKRNTHWTPPAPALSAQWEKQVVCSLACLRFPLGQSTCHSREALRPSGRSQALREGLQ